MAEEWESGSEWKTHDETAGHVRRSPQALHQLNYRGDGPPAYKVGGRLLYRRDEVDAWIVAQRDPRPAA